MRRALGTAAAAIVLVASIGAGASADDAGGGTQRWTAGFDAGAPAFSNDIAVTPDGTTAFVTGGTTMGPTGHMARPTAPRSGPRSSPAPPTPTTSVAARRSQ